MSGTPGGGDEVGRAIVAVGSNVVGVVKRGVRDGETAVGVALIGNEAQADRRKMKTIKQKCLHCMRQL